MAVELATAYVSLVPSARGISSAITKELAAPTQRAAAAAGTSASKSFTGKFSTGLKVLGGALISGFVFKQLVSGVGDLVTAAEDSIKVSRQTNAVLKSTGGVANVTADSVAKLAEQLSKKAGVDDELIQSGANVLLTFKNVRNEVGRGNDIFDQATNAALDMSVAMGQDLQSSVVQIGKALNDPIKGMTALQRVGVTFSEDQKAVIKRLVETGDTLGAQKIILKELTTEFGGSAAAQATASDKLAVAWDNLKEKLGTQLLPVVEDFSDWLLDKGIPAVEDFAGWITDTLVPALGDIKTWVGDNVVPPLESMWRVLNDDLLPIFGDVADFINDKLAPAFNSLRDAVGGSNDAAEDSGPSWAGWITAIGVVAGGAALIARTAAPLIPIFKAVGVALGFLGFAATMAFNLILKILPFSHIAALALLFRDQITDIIGTAWRNIRDFFIQGGTWIKEHWTDTWNQITRTLSDWWATTSAFFAALPGRIRSYFASALTWLIEGGRNILRGLANGIAEIWRGLANWFTDRKATIQNFFTNAIDWLLLGGKNILRGMWKGIREVWAGIVDWFKDLPNKILDALGIASPPKWAIEAGRWILKGITKGLGLGVGKVMDFMGNLVGKFSAPLRAAWDDVFGATKEFLIGGPSGYAGLAEPFASAIRALINASGGLITIGSGRRSRAEQEALYAAYLARGKAPPVVARPGTSKHERGLAADLRGPYGLMHRLAKSFGIIFPVRGEPWHAQLGPGRSYYAQGTWRTRDEWARLHPNEMVIPAGLATALRALPGGPGGTGGGIGGPLIGTVNIYANDRPDGLAAARGFEDYLTRRRITTDARIA